MPLHYVFSSIGYNQTMTLSEFKQRVRVAFGPNMEHATPANVREFLDAIAHDRWHEERAAHWQEAVLGEAPPLEIPAETPITYEDILRHFFADALAAPNEQALLHLWLLALELAYAGVEEQAAQEIGPLFADSNP